MYWQSRRMFADSARLVELINRRRRQLHVHAVLYYEMDRNLISDATFDAWSKELVELQALCPKYRDMGYRPDLFRDWSGETGMHLKSDERTWNLAEELIRIHEKRMADELAR